MKVLLSLILSMQHWKWDQTHKLLRQLFLQARLDLLKFIRQDINNYYYVETERITNDDYVHLEVRRYDAEGNLVSTVEAQNDYYCEVDKSIDVDELGNIYQLFPSEEGVKIFKWVLN